MVINLSIVEIRDILIGYGYNIYMLGSVEYAQKDTINLPIIKAFKAHLKLKFSNVNLQFSGLSKITVGSTEPVNPSHGDLWFYAIE